MNVSCRLDDILEALAEQEQLVFILEDWDEGLQVRFGVGGDEVKQAVKEARGKYGPRFAFRAFNFRVDAWWWNGEVGVVQDEPLEGQVETVKLFLEPDWRRYPGMGAFAQELCPAEECPNLRPFFIEAVPLRTELGIHWRFLRLGQTPKEERDREEGE